MIISIGLANLDHRSGLEVNDITEFLLLAGDRQRSQYNLFDILPFFFYYLYICVCVYANNVLAGSD